MMASQSVFNERGHICVREIDSGLKMYHFTTGNSTVFIMVAVLMTEMTYHDLKYPDNHQTAD